MERNSVHQRWFYLTLGMFHSLLQIEGKLTKLGYNFLKWRMILSTHKIRLLSAGAIAQECPRRRSVQKPLVLHIGDLVKHHHTSSVGICTADANFERDFCTERRRRGLGDADTFHNTYKNSIMHFFYLPSKTKQE